MSTGGTRPEKRCTYANCDRPEHGSDFHQIEAGRRSGGQDWSALAGFTLCNACYQQYKRRGTLERSRNKPIQAGKRRSEPPLLPPSIPPPSSVSCTQDEFLLFSFFSGWCGGRFAAVCCWQGTSCAKHRGMHRNQFHARKGGGERGGGRGHCVALAKNPCRQRWAGGSLGAGAS